MISYLLATKHDIGLSLDTVDSILALPKHDMEIIICSPIRTEIQDDRIKWVQDDKCTGSPYAFNKAYKHSIGDYVSVIIDDILLPLNFLDILDFMKSSFMKKKKFKVSNILWDGGPGLVTYGHDELEDGTSLWPKDKWHCVNVDYCPYNVIPLPFFERNTIQLYLSDCLFHPAFKNHFIDHWLGFYLCKNERHEPHKWRCPSIQYKMSPNRKPTEVTDDSYDTNVLQCLTNTFVNGETSYI